MGNGEPIKSSDYIPLGRVTEYKFCTKLSDVIFWLNHRIVANFLSQVYNLDYI